MKNLLIWGGVAVIAYLVYQHIQKEKAKKEMAQIKAAKDAAKKILTSKNKW